MFDITAEARLRIENKTKAEGLTTGKIRKISAELFRGIEDKSIENIFRLCEEFLEHHDWALGVIAYDWAFRVRTQYNHSTFSVFEEWLNKYVTGWGDCDDFCTHAVGELISQNNGLFVDVLKWTESQSFCMRRAASVSLIYPIRKNKYKDINPFLVSDALMQDEHDLVRKGYGWMLKVLSQTEPNKVYEYLLKYKNVMPRVSFRYALEKFDEKKRLCLMDKEV